MLEDCIYKILGIILYVNLLSQGGFWHSVFGDEQFFPRNPGGQTHV